MEVTGYINGIAHTENIQDHLLNGSGQKKIQCPVCPTVGKKNITAKPLSLNRETKVFNCHKCGWAGGYGENEKDDTWAMKKKYKTPVIRNNTDLTMEHLQLFSRRMISQKTLIRNDVRSIVGKNNKTDFFAFQYLKGENLIKVKYKNKDKIILQYAGCEPCIFKYNDVFDQQDIIITEGEEEAFIWEEAGYQNACSVDSGAPNENDKTVDGKLQCITNCYEVFEQAEIVVIAVDADSSGRRLQAELIKRIGAEKCKIIDFTPAKDANEYAMKFGLDGLKMLYDKAKNIKIDGLIEAEHYFYNIMDAYMHGQPHGTTTFFPLIDPIWTWRLGELNIWTGYNNEGKSQLLKQLMIAKSLGDDWKHAIFMPEEWPPEEIYIDLIESLVGKSADPLKKKYKNFMTVEELNFAMEYINQHFYIVYPKEDHSIQELLKLFQITIRKYGVKTVTLDPYNQIHHKMEFGDREDLYISRFLSKVKRFSVMNNVAFNIVAHQKTPPIKHGQDRPKPDVFYISGGANFANKGDNVLSVQRPYYVSNYSDRSVHLTSGKIKKQKLTGRPGTVSLMFNRKTNQYEQGDGYCPVHTLYTRLIDRLAKENDTQKSLFS